LVKLEDLVAGIMATAHTYSPLNISRNEIRVVILEPSQSFKAKVVCRLIHRSLDSDAAFEALSYTWGDGSAKRPISLNRDEFLVTKNLDTTLRYLRYVSDERAILIDALCINQYDTTAVTVKTLSVQLNPGD
jgi:hypothetical protein